MATYLNNPLNIRAGQNWLGLVGEKNGFCQFRHEKYSVRAALYLIFFTYPRKYGAKTIEDAITLYAPPADGNNTTAYIGYVCNHVGVSSTFRLSNFRPYSRFLLIQAMAKIESSTTLSLMFFQQNYKLFQLKL